jgi:hypothetical protein
VDPAKMKVLSEAQAIANEWVTSERLKHVLDSLGNPTGMEAMPEIIKAMLEDITREGKGEIIESKDARKVIGSKTVMMFKIKLKEDLIEKAKEMEK